MQWELSELNLQTVILLQFLDTPGDEVAPRSNKIGKNFENERFRHAYTRLYFADEPANASDPVLNSIKNKKRRQTLIASPGMENGKTVYRFDIRLQGDNETVFFDM